MTEKYRGTGTIDVCVWCMMLRVTEMMDDAIEISKIQHSKNTIIMMAGQKTTVARCKDRTLA